MARAYSTTNKIHYVELDNHVEGIMPGGSIFYIDKEDYGFVKEKAWFLSDGYLRHHKLGLFHRIIMKDKLSKGLEIDHINRNRLDNRKDNLRVLTRQENMKNKSIYSSNTSGYKGVKWNKSLEKWQVQITVNKRRIHLGVYSDLQEAIAERRKAEIKYFPKL